jgi:protein-L-isoaspartate(D-aspartate) O-methyltransferase
MLSVKRHEFVPDRLKHLAYQDRPLPIGHDQTISQPYIVALMTWALNPDKNDKILEVGTGSGYQAAVLAEIVDQVYSVEIVEPLGEKARKLYKIRVIIMYMYALVMDIKDGKNTHRLTVSLLPVHHLRCPNL